MLDSVSIGQALVLGTIQGLTEFLPISSSGHLIFIPKLFGWADQGLAFDVVVHLGTLVAVVAYFWKRLMTLARAFFTSPQPSPNRKGDGDRTLAAYLLISIIPAALVGFFFGDWIEAHTRSAVVVAWSLIGWGVVLGIADRLALKHKNMKIPPPRDPDPGVGTQKTLSDLTWRDTFFIACAQAIALIPGTSRSGITMTAGLLARLDKKSAVEFSFLMAIPVIALAGAAKLTELWAAGGAVGLGAGPLWVGFVSAAVSGLAAIWFLMKVIQRWSFMPFVAYRVVVGVLILATLS